MPPPELIDTHCHLNFQRYDHDREAALARAKAAGVSRIIIPAIDLPSCGEALELARAHPGIHAALGVHPNSARDFSRACLDEIRALACQPKVVAIGEIGLDYYWDKCPPDLQRQALEAQLALAAELELPVILHNREAGDDLLAVLEAYASAAPQGLRDRLGVLHSFSASAQMAQRAIELGFYIGFTGPITYKKAAELRAVAAKVPLERLLIETDGPFLAPQARRGKRNEPAYLPMINEKLADVRGISPAEMARHTSVNAQRLFKLA